MSLDEHVLQDTIVSQLGVHESEVFPSARFIEDLGADSLDCIELLMSIEDVFGFEMPDEDAEKLHTVGELSDYLKSHGHIA